MSSLFNFFKICFSKNYEQQQDEQQQDENHIETSYYNNINNLKLVHERVWTKFRSFDTWVDTFADEQVEAMNVINEIIANNELKYYKLTFILEEYESIDEIS